MAWRCAFLRGGELKSSDLYLLVVVAAVGKG